MVPDVVQEDTTAVATINRVSIAAVVVVAMYISMAADVEGVETLAGVMDSNGGSGDGAVFSYTS